MTRKMPAENFIAKMEAFVASVFEDKESTTEQKMKAAEIGLKIITAKHKIAPSEGEDGSFFNNKG